MYYNKITEKTTMQLTEQLLNSKIKNPKPEHYENEGWCLTPVQFQDVPTGYFRIESTKSIKLIDGIPYYDYQLETQTEKDARVAVIEQEELVQTAASLSTELMTKYTTFLTQYQQTIQAVQAVNPDIPTDIDYPSLINALMLLEGEIWTKLSLVLTLLWNDVVVQAGSTPLEAYNLIPSMEYRRLNPDIAIEGNVI